MLKEVRTGFVDESVRLSFGRHGIFCEDWDEGRVCSPAFRRCLRNRDSVSSLNASWRRSHERLLRDPVGDHLAGHVGQTKVPTLEAVGQAQVVQAELVQHRGVQVVCVDGLVGDAPADLV